MTNDKITIHIGKATYQLTEPTTGTELYNLADLPDDYELWLEVPGPGDDELIANDDTPVAIKPGAHLYGAQKTLNPGAL